MEKNNGRKSDDYWNKDEQTWIRGVNVGGWLLAERFITPYLFALNSCHLEGDLCWYPGQIGAPTNATICDPKICEPILTVWTKDGNADYHPRDAQWYYDYPQDEFTLGKAFANKPIAKKYMERHWDTFVTFNDLKRLKRAGVTHLRVPLGYWIRGDVLPGEPWVDGGWPYFVRMVRWCRTIGLQVWADLHGAPGSENGFDNSGRYNMESSTCAGWSDSPENVARTLNIIEDISAGIVEDELMDVVTGFGLLNEPFLDCDDGVLRRYYNDAFAIVRGILGDDTHIFVGDMFNAWKFNNGFWTDEATHYNTYLDTHPYHIFFEKGRAMTPKQHIAYVCRYNAREVNSCCHKDYEDDKNNEPANGISRIIGEWSAAYDILPTALTQKMMRVIAKDGKAPMLGRQASLDRQAFMRHFVEAQMVTYESQATGVSRGWLFWNFKMEGGAFLEWDFLRGIEEGWIPPIPPPTVSSESLYGSCYDIINRTNDYYNTVVDEYPNPRTLDWSQWQGWNIDDDYVLQISDDVRMYNHNKWARGISPASLSIAFVLVICFPFALRKFQTWRKTEYVQLK